MSRWVTRRFSRWSPANDIYYCARLYELPQASLPTNAATVARGFPWYNAAAVRVACLACQEALKLRNSSLFGTILAKYALEGYLHSD